MDVKVLGTGCSSCQTLERRVRTVVDETEIDASVEKIEEIQEIMQYNVMSMPALVPALVIDGEVKSSGHAPSVSELKDLLAA
jgi:small redox-active disulfide protein 2